jgi:hypothetical protein
MYKGVACIQADSNSGLVINESNDVSEVFKSRPNDVSSASHILEQYFHKRGCAVGAIESISYAGDSFTTGTAEGRTWTAI